MMKKTIAISISVLVCLLFITGCYPNTEESSVQTADEMQVMENNTTDVENNTIDIENNTTEVNENSTEEVNTSEERTAEENQDLINELMSDLGVNNTEENTTNEAETNLSEETGPEEYTIELINMRGKPEKDLNIKIGDSVTWISRQPNYVHRIQLREKLDSGTYGETILDPVASLKINESFTYQFEDAAVFQWYSKTNYPTTSGTITVTE